MAYISTFVIMYWRNFLAFGVLRRAHTVLLSWSTQSSKIISDGEFSFSYTCLLARYSFNHDIICWNRWVSFTDFPIVYQFYSKMTNLAESTNTNWDRSELTRSKIEWARKWIILNVAQTCMPEDLLKVGICIWYYPNNFIRNRRNLFTAHFGLLSNCTMYALQHSTGQNWWYFRQCVVQQRTTDQY